MIRLKRSSNAWPFSAIRAPGTSRQRADRGVAGWASTARIIEKWRASSASWPTGVVFPAHEGNCLILLPVSNGEPISTTLGRHDGLSPEPAARLEENCVASTACVV